MMEEGEDERVYVGGRFNRVNGVPIESFAVWDSAEWQAVDPSVAGAFHRLIVFDFGEGPRLVAAGLLERVGEFSGIHVVRLEDNRWELVGNLGSYAGWNYSTVWALVEAGGRLTVSWLYDFGKSGIVIPIVSEWEGMKWMVPGPGVLDFADVCEGPGFVSGGLPTGLAIARGWSTAFVVERVSEGWYTIGELPLAQGGFDAIEAVDFGAGPEIALGGWIGSVTSGTGLIMSWTPTGGAVPLGAGADGPVMAMTRFHDGTEPKLVALGSFSQAGGEPASGMAYWDGSRWEGVTQVEHLPSWGWPWGNYGSEPFVKFNADGSQTLCVPSCREPGTTLLGVGVLRGSPICAPDMTGDGVLDLFDWLAFVSFFIAGSTRADCDGDHAVTVLDFSCFGHAFAAGCP